MHFKPPALTRRQRVLCWLFKKIESVSRDVAFLAMEAREKTDPYCFQRDVDAEIVRNGRRNRRAK
jgi:hypothetical protein